MEAVITYDPKTRKFVITFSDGRETRRVNTLWAATSIAKANGATVITDRTK